MPNLAFWTRQLALFAVVAALVATAVASPTNLTDGARLAAAGSAAGTHNAYSKAAFTATNTARRNRDRAALRGNSCLKAKALAHARWMARTGRMEHQALGPIQRACGVGYVGENIAYGYSSGSALVWQGWMTSAGHRANILSRGYRLMGLAAVKDDDGRWWSAQVFGAR